MGGLSIELWLNEHKRAALEEALDGQGTSIEKALQEHLINLYSELVPFEKQQEVRVAIDADAAAAEEHRQATRRFGVFRITENGHATYLESEQSKSPMNAAWQARLYLKWKSKLSTDQRSFVAKIAPTAGIDERVFDERLLEFQAGGRQVQGAFSLDFDRNQFAFWVRDLGWQTYTMKDACVAAYHAYRKVDRANDERQDTFGHYLTGRELSMNGSAQEEDHSPQMGQF